MLTQEMTSTNNLQELSIYSWKGQQHYNLTTMVMISLVLGWAFTYFDQLVSRRAHVVDPDVNKVPQPDQEQKKPGSNYQGADRPPGFLSVQLGRSVKGLPPTLAGSDPADGSFPSPPLTSGPTGLLSPIFSTSNRLILTL